MASAGISAPEPLGPQHEIEGFDCGEERLNELLKRNVACVRSPAAPKSVRGQTFVAAAGRQVAAFYTTRPGSLSLAGGDGSETVLLMVTRHFAVDRRWKDGKIAADFLHHLVRNNFSAAPANGARALFGYAITANQAHVPALGRAPAT